MCAKAFCDRSIEPCRGNGTLTLEAGPNVGSTTIQATAPGDVSAAAVVCVELNPVDCGRLVVEVTTTADGLMAATVKTETKFRVTGRTVLFPDVYYSPVRAYAHYDVDPRSRRFLMLKGEGASGDIVVVANWFEELRRRMGN